ncbi:Glucan endo-1 3-beta-glucosidase [Melia azedarach]|uniref:Glucan endo-1 3-beta-glucosidase n=1 Tax=Melia azedarach TaxID=155640 RepID=A0ACC1XQ40_MELAZ|nr:Glucan endo-1 3-beta-glucosidase [Melia azedarach]
MASGTTKFLLFTAFLLHFSTVTYSIDDTASNVARREAVGRHLQARRTWLQANQQRSARIKGLAKKSREGNRPRIAPVSTPIVLRPVLQGKKFCVPKPGVSETILLENIDWGCKMGVDCDPLVNTKEVSCSDKSLWIKSAYVMNYFFNANARNESACNFNGTGFLTLANPSDGKCAFI